MNPPGPATIMSFLEFQLKRGLSDEDKKRRNPKDAFVYKRSDSKLIILFLEF
jgi:hypothetical protein